MWQAYARVFGYDEEGRLVRIERDYGTGDLQVAYAYGYNSDGVRVWKQDVVSQQEYRYVCRIGCGGIPMRVYSRAMGNNSWASVADYLPAGNALGYGTRWQVELDTNTVMTAGFGESLQVTTAYQDSFGVDLSLQMTPCVEQAIPATVQPCPPLGSGDGCEEVRQQLAFFTLFPCLLLPRACTPPERQQCSQCCHQAGGIMINCEVFGGGMMLCYCMKECTPAQWRACDRDCLGQGRGRAVGCNVDGVCENGKLRNPERRCRCELPSPPLPKPQPKPRPKPHPPDLV